jgi:hypothetical protein
MDANPHHNIDDLIINAKICSSDNTIRIEWFHKSEDEIDELQPPEELNELDVMVEVNKKETIVKYISNVHPRSNRTARKRPETAVVIRQSRNVYKNGVKRWSFRSKKRPETAVAIRTDGSRWNRVKIKAVNRRFRSFKAPFPVI